MLNCSVVFLYYTFSYVLVPSGIFLGIYGVPLKSSLAPVKWDSLEGQTRDQWDVEMAWEFIAMMCLPSTSFFPFQTSEILDVKLPWLFVWYPKPPNIPFLWEWAFALHSDTFPSFIPMLWAVRKIQLKLAFFTHILLLHSSLILFLLISKAQLSPSALLFSFLALYCRYFRRQINSLHNLGI